MLKDLLLTGEEVSILGAPLAAKVTFPVFNSQLKLKSKQAMITLQGMAEHRLSNVYNYPSWTVRLYLFMCILIFNLIPFHYYL